MTKRRLHAYYYAFEPTGNDAIDAILEAVAKAGKAFHHTDQWAEDMHGAGAPVDWIQDAANEAAEAVNLKVVK